MTDTSKPLHLAGSKGCTLAEQFHRATLAVLAGFALTASAEDP